ncbi:hypothetical protein CP973_20890 [Streptomyces albofaciens JCM 4342]|uniref:hypothetical protein n=1 Tax=Streptomyces albofaciens TaxID=66866 RepID=UPI001238D5DB|nr:hypothetical protein [Streptomyces albofaciens]KAA6224035.1 hypothetical protein CP973_20890 [Streptomyces albofaciens JCM 4342]
MVGCCCDLTAAGWAVATEDAYRPLPPPDDTAWQRPPGLRGDLFATVSEVRRGGGHLTRLQPPAYRAAVRAALADAAHIWADT